MIMLGKTARKLRDAFGLKQRDVADALGISVVHLCNIENNKAAPSAAILESYREIWGVDLYVLAWCLYGDVSKLPPAVRKSANELAKAMQKQIDSIVKRRREDDSPCSVSGR